MCTEDNMVIMCVTVAIIIMVQYYNVGAWLLTPHQLGIMLGGWPGHCGRCDVSARYTRPSPLCSYSATGQPLTSMTQSLRLPFLRHTTSTVDHDKHTVKLLRPGHGQAPCDGVTGNIPIIWEDIVVLVVGSNTTLAHGCLSSPR